MPPRAVTSSMIDPGWPDEVKSVLSAVPAPPYADPTLGIAVPEPARIEMPPHPLVVLGDSLASGFKSAAIHDTDRSHPMLIAWELGCDDRFRRPSYPGCGGLPLNLEWLIYEVQRVTGTQVKWWEVPPALFRLRQAMDELEDWWERGPGSYVPRYGGIMHNLSVYGWDLRDALGYTAGHCRALIEERARRDHWVRQVIENAREIAALRVLESAQDAEGRDLTPLQAARALGEEGGTAPDGTPLAGIETLVVALGSNNALGSVLRLGRPAWSRADEYEDLVLKNRATVWLPSHFEAEYRRVAAQVEAVKARHVIFANVPHVTIAPIARGVATKVERGSRYFPYYTRPWIADRQFDPKDDPHITENEARAIDSVIDAYNRTIADAVRTGRREGRRWFLLDQCGLLDRLASRRYIEDVQARPAWWTPYELPPALARLDPPLTSRLLRSSRKGREDGGLFSLDGVHPTTAGYGILAQEVIRIMEKAGATFLYGDQRTVRTGPIQVDFERVLRLDTLVSKPPPSLDSTMSVLGWMDQALDVFSRLMPHGLRGAAHSVGAPR